MGDDIRIDAQFLERQFWLRVLLAIGILWGTMPPIAIAFIFIGWQGPAFDLATLIFNAFTVLPACVLAFWHRRTACVWLSVNAVLAAITLLDYARHPALLNFWEAVGIAGPLMIAIVLDWMEIRGWPGALER
ncbi:MAG: hypothetical protein WBE72_11685 [Terracidiphilus sp.]